MNRLLTLILCLSMIALSGVSAAAQQPSVPPAATAAYEAGVESSLANDSSVVEGGDALRQSRQVLSKHLESVDPNSSEYDEIIRAMREIDVRLHDSARSTAMGKATAAVPQSPPSFQLSTPGDNLTNEPMQPTLSWTEDQSPAPRPVIERYVIEISDEKDFRTIVYKNEEVKPRPHPLTIEHTVPEGVLEPGVTYYWRVSAIYVINSAGSTVTQLASNAPFSFTTARSIFKRFSDRGFSLQRAVAGPDADKGAEFSFLRNLGKNNVYTADFALIHNHRFHQTSRTSVGLQTSVEGKLTSDDSESEDAWRFRAGAVIDRNLKPGSLNLIYLSLGGKFEGDQDFDVKKVSFEALFTPTLPDLFIGVSKPLDTASPFQFRWRPFLGIDAGRTIKRGSSSEVKENVFRMVPRVTAKLKLNFLNEVLKLNEVYLWMDETYYYLPLESKKERNFFTSGLEFEVTDNLGFGVTYKNGESAPKFKRVNTLGATISIRFGKGDQ